MYHKLTQAYVFFYSANKYRITCDVIYGDTDSIFFKFLGLPDTEEGLLATFELSELLAGQITRLFPKGGTMKIVHEKSARCLALYHAKCYALIMYTKDKDGKLKAPDIQIKGLQSNKRDTVKFARDIGTNIIRITLLESVDKAIQYTRQELRSVLDPDVDVTKFMVYKKVGKTSYKPGQEPGHVILAKRMAERNPATAPKTGQEVKFFYIAQKNSELKPVRSFSEKQKPSGKKMADMIEDCDTVLQNKLPIDMVWYLQNQVRNVIATNFKPFLKDAAHFLMEDIIREAYLKQNKLQTVEEAMLDDSRISDHQEPEAPPSKKGRFLPSWY